MYNIRIKEIVLENISHEKFPYEFENGVNYYKGINGCGKTEFLKFMDYMLGSSTVKLEGEWYNDFYKGTISIEKKGTEYKFSRFRDKTKFLFQINDEQEEICNSEHYIAYLSVVATEENSRNLQEFRIATGIDLTCRSCAPFMFLDETAMESSSRSNFLTKCKDYKYQKWVSMILDYLFHPQSSDIYLIRKEIEALKIKLKKQQETLNQLDLYKKSINESLKGLNSKIEFSNNIDNVRKEFEKIKSFSNTSKIPNIEHVYQLNDITEKIKSINDSKDDLRNFNKSAQNRKEMLERMKKLISINEDYKIFVEPISRILEELTTTVSFSEILLKHKNETNLTKIEQELKHELEVKNNNKRYIELDDKIQSISIGERFLNLYEKEYEEINIQETIDSLKNKEDELDKIMHNLDEEKLRDFSKIVMKLYKSAENVSPLVKSDFEMEGFILDYIEKNNAIVPSIIIYDDDKHEDNVHVMMYRGSQARASIIQLCGYCALQILIQKDKTIPCFPLIVMDHITKPYSEENLKAIGSILNKFYEIIGTQNFQIIMLDIKDPKELNIANYTEKEFLTEKKSGFIPWINEKK